MDKTEARPYPKNDETELIARARAGKPEAFAELVNRHSQQVYGVSLRMLKNHEDAEDNVQNVLCKAYNHIKQFEGNSRFSTWLVRIAINEALMKIRQTRSDRTANTPRRPPRTTMNPSFRMLPITARTRSVPTLPKISPPKPLTACTLPFAILSSFTKRRAGPTANWPAPWASPWRP